MPQIAKKREHQRLMPDAGWGRVADVRFFDNSNLFFCCKRRLIQSKRWQLDTLINIIQDYEFI